MHRKGKQEVKRLQCVDLIAVPSVSDKMITIFAAWARIVSVSGAALRRIEEGEERHELLICDDGAALDTEMLKTAEDAIQEIDRFSSEAHMAYRAKFGGAAGYRAAQRDHGSI